MQTINFQEYFILVIFDSVEKIIRKFLTTKRIEHRLNKFMDHFQQRILISCLLLVPILLYCDHIYESPLGMGPECPGLRSVWALLLVTWTQNLWLNQPCNRESVSDSKIFQNYFELTGMNNLFWINISAIKFKFTSLKTCLNTAGSYECVCHDGFSKKENTRNHC